LSSAKSYLWSRETRSTRTYSGECP
jgi:hypothetical protein